jgi:hypothetical protein
VKIPIATAAFDVRMMTVSGRGSERDGFRFLAGESVGIRGEVVASFDAGASEVPHAIEGTEALDLRFLREG